MVGVSFVETKVCLKKYYVNISVYGITIFF